MAVKKTILSTTVSDSGKTTGGNNNSGASGNTSGGAAGGKVAGTVKPKVEKLDVAKPPDAEISPVRPVASTMGTGSNAGNTSSTAATGAGAKTSFAPVAADGTGGKVLENGNTGITKPVYTKPPDVEITPVQPVTSPSATGGNAGAASTNKVTPTISTTDVDGNGQVVSTVGKGTRTPVTTPSTPGTGNAGNGNTDGAVPSKGAEMSLSPAPVAADGTVGKVTKPVYTKPPDAEITPVQPVVSTMGASQGSAAQTDSGEPVEVEISDWNGVRKGYIINGATYYDPEGKNRVGAGTVVTDVNGNKWIMTENGGVPYSRFLKENLGVESWEEYFAQFEDTAGAGNTGGNTAGGGTTNTPGVDAGGAGNPGAEVQIPEQSEEVAQILQNMAEIMDKWSSSTLGESTALEADPALRAQMEALISKWSEISNNGTGDTAQRSAQTEAILAQLAALAEKWNSAKPSGSEANVLGGDQMRENMTALLAQWKKAAEQQSENQIDYTTQQGITELERAKEDAQAQFKTRQDQIAADEMAAKDNAALYAEMRGDKGGIGQAQYNAIANTAAINRQTVASEQTKLSTDTARQIADLRAQGEFEKADALLQISQQYLSQLVSLEQWAAEYGLSAEQFKETVRQWEAEYGLAVDQYISGVNQWLSEYDLSERQFEEAAKQWEAEYGLAADQFAADMNQQLTQQDFNERQLAETIRQWEADYNMQSDQFATSLGQWAAEYDLSEREFEEAVRQWAAEYDLSEAELQEAIRQWEAEYELSKADLIGNLDGEPTLSAKNQISDIAAALLDAGIGLTAEQLEALGMTSAQAQEYQLAQELAAKASGYSSGSKSTSKTQQSSNALIGTDEWYRQLRDTYGDNVSNMLTYYYSDLGVSNQTAAKNALEGYNTWLAKQRGDPEKEASTALEKRDDSHDSADVTFVELAYGMEDLVAEYGKTDVKIMIEEAYKNKQILLGEKNLLIAQLSGL